jgi:hypothetical protein
MEITRPLRAGLFLLGLLASNSLWVMVGGQYHLDLLSWAWKLTLTLAAATLVVVLATASRTRALAAAALLIVVIAAAGWLTYQAHLNEPGDEEEETEQVTRYQTRQASPPFDIG